MTRVVPTGATSVLLNTAPILTALLAAVFLTEQLKILGWAGMLVSFTGAVLIAVGEGQGFSVNKGAALILLAAVSVSAYLLIQKPYLVHTQTRW